MIYIFQNWDKTKTVAINSQDYPDAYLFIKSGVLCFELLNRPELESGIFTYYHNDYVVTVESDVITVWSPMAQFDSFVDEISDYFQT